MQIFKTKIWRKQEKIALDNNNNKVKDETVLSDVDVTAVTMSYGYQRYHSVSINFKTNKN